MKSVEYKNINVYDYAKNRISRELDKYLQKLFCSNNRERIVWSVFDKEKFDRKLKSDIRKIYVQDFDLASCWDECLKNMSDVYMQQEFLLDSYGHAFKMFGKYRDYGAIIFYAINVKNNVGSCKELISNWFNLCVVSRYKFEKEQHSKLRIYSKKPFELYVRWNPIADAAMHFDNTLTLERIKEQMIILAREKQLCIKSIDDYIVVFE